MNISASTILADSTMIQRMVNQRLTSFFTERSVAAKGQSDAHGLLWETMSNFVLSGGKRVRPQLVIWSYQAFALDGALEDIIDIAAALELLHAGLLVHDDIIDNDDTRYGRLNIMGTMEQRYSTSKFSGNITESARSAALLAGDLLLSEAYQSILESPVSSAQKITLCRQLGLAIFTVGGGELLDMESVLRDFADVDPVAIARLKTAHYSFVTPLTMGARLGGASEDDIAALQQLGLNLGIAYQLHDDVLGIFGDQSKTGKTTLGDIREGKRTLLMALALEAASDSQKQILNEALGNPHLTETQADAVRAVVHETGAYQSVIQTINNYTDQARAALVTLTFRPEVAQQFERLIQKVTNRAA